MINNSKMKNWNWATKDSLVGFCEAMISNLNTTENKIFFNDILTDLQSGISNPQNHRQAFLLLYFNPSITKNQALRPMCY